MKIGGRAGEILDVVDIEARRLIAEGNAENPYAPKATEPAPETPVTMPSAPESVYAKFSRKKRNR